MAKLGITNEGRLVGVWAQSRTNASASIQADATSASLEFWPDERGSAKELPFVLGVSHSVDKDEREGFLQIPTMEGKRKTRYYTFPQLIRALDAADVIEELIERVAALEAAAQPQGQP